MIRVDAVFEMDPMLFKDSNPRARQAASWGKRWCHLFCDSPEEIEALHRIAEQIGLHRSYFQNKPGFPHYDLVPNKRKQAVRAGAVETDLRKWLTER